VKYHAKDLEIGPGVLVSVLTHPGRAQVFVTASQSRVQLALVSIEREPLMGLRDALIEACEELAGAAIVALAEDARRPPDEWEPEGGIARAMTAAEEAVVLEVRVVFSDDEQESRYWLWGDVKAADAAPEIKLQDWMIEPRKTWGHPQEPIIYSTLVAPGQQYAARAWLESLGGRRER
jgi:hypothetical protein